MADADGYIFNKTDAERIAKAVKRVESRDQGGGELFGRRRGGMPPVYYGKIMSDVAANASVDVRLLEGGVGSEAVPGSNYVTRNAHNITNRKLWADSFCVLEWPFITGSGGKWRIVWSDSAQWLYGKTSGTIAYNSSGTVNTITLIDGRTGPGSSITAYNRMDSHSLASSAWVLCVWSQPNARWEIVGTLPGSGGTSKMSCFWLGEQDTVVTIAYPSTISTNPIEWTAYPTSGFSDMSLTAGTNNNRFTSTADNNGLVITGCLSTNCDDFATGEQIDVEFWLYHKNSGGSVVSTLFNRVIPITDTAPYDTMSWVVPVELDTNDYIEGKILVTPQSPTSVADFNYTIQMSVQKTTTGG